MDLVLIAAGGLDDIGALGDPEAGGDGGENLVPGGAAAAAAGGGARPGSMAAMRAQVRNEMDKSVSTIQNAGQDKRLADARKSMGGVVKGLPMDMTSAMDDLSSMGKRKSMKIAARSSFRP